MNSAMHANMVVQMMQSKAIALTYSMTEIKYMPQSLITDRSSLIPREGPGDEAKTDTLRQTRLRQTP